MENKITEEQLKDLQELVSKINQASSQIGNLELQKQGFVGQAAEHQRDLNKLQDKLEKTYGKIQIDINNGSFKSIEEEAEVV
jgi:predicted  nucleic acid-binding Zn-ribbon protein